MRIALLVGADPRICERGPQVRLPNGRWCLVFEGLVDSSLDLHLSTVSEPLAAIHNLHFDGPCIAMLEFSNRGCEQYINALVKRVA